MPRWLLGIPGDDPQQPSDYASGFPNRVDSTLTFVGSTVTIAPTVPGGSFSFFVNGYEFPKSAAESYVLPDTEGLWFVYYDGAGVLQATQSQTTIDAVFGGAGAAVAAAYWDDTNNILLRQIDERHGIALPGATHLYLHKYLGTAYESGGGLGDFTIVAGPAANAVDAQFSVANTIVSDEDLRRIIDDDAPQDLAPIAMLPVFYLDGPTPGIWRRKTADTFPIIYSGTAGYVGANGRLPFNHVVAGNWVLSQVLNADFVLLHVFASTDEAEPIFAVQGQATYANLADAREGALTEANSILGLAALLSTEKRILGTVIYQSHTAATNVPKAKVVLTDTGANYVDWRSTPFFAGIVGGGNSFPLAFHLTDGSTIVPTDLWTPPGIVLRTDGVHLFEGGQAAGFTNLPGDGSTAILDVVIAGLNTSAEYTATLSVRVVFLSNATNAIVGSVDFSVDLYVVTDGGGVATVTFQTTPSPDPSRLPATMALATCTAAANAGGFRVSASRHPGYASSARAFWWATEWIEL